MKRTFADLHLRANNKDPKHLTKIAGMAAELGYRLVATPFFPETSQDEIRKVKKIFNDFGLDFASRTDIRPRHPDDLLPLLRKTRRRFEIICVLCEKKEIARQAAKDHRVDLLNFPLLDYRDRFLDRAESELASCGSAAFEVDMKPLLVLEGPPRIRFLSTLRREIATALEFRLPIIISSGVSEVLFLRKPREMALFSSLFGLVGEAALDAVSSNPFDIVSRNRGKLAVGFVAPGIRIIKKGGDS